MVDYKIKDRVSIDRAKLFGFTSELYSKVIEQRMTSDFAVENVLAEAEEPFFSKNDDESAPVGWWRGEFWGKWMISAVRACKYEYNEKLATIIRNSLGKIMATADEFGYIGTYKDRKLVLPCPKELGAKIIGFRCDFCWNIWCQKYTLWALIEAYELFGDESILIAAEKMANQLIDVVHELGVNPCETGTFFGVASGSIMKPMLMLYRHTANKKLLDFVISIADGFENKEAKCIKIIKKSLEEIPIHIWNYDNPVAEKRSTYTSQKAYEMMSCFEGICELYRITGIEKYLTATQKFYALLMKYEYNRLFCVGFNDRFLFAAVIEDAISEPCDIIHFLRLTADLYLITGESRYMELYELAFVNPFLASLTRDGSYGARAVRSMSHPVTERDVVRMKYNHCCVNNMPRAFEHAATMIASENDDGIFVNLYLPSALKLRQGELQISDGYMKECKVEIRVSAPAATTVHLRIPSWSKKTNVSCGGTSYAPACNGYFDLPITAGDTVILVEFDRTPRLMYGNYERHIFPMTPYLKQRYDLIEPAEPTNENKATLCIGPVLLAMTTQLGTSWKYMLERPTVNGICKSCTAEPVEKEGTIACYNVTFETAEGKETIPMCDFVSASNRFIPEDYSIFV